MRMLSVNEYVMPVRQTKQHYNELEAMRRGTYNDTSKELVKQFIESNKKLDRVYDRLSSLETAELRRKNEIKLQQNIRFDRKGLSGVMKFRKHQESLS